MSILTIVHSLRYPLVRLMNSSHHTSYAVYTILPIGYDTKFHNRIIYCIFRVQSQKLSTLTLTRPCGGQSVHLVPTTPRREFRVLFPSQPHISPRIHQGPPSADPIFKLTYPKINNQLQTLLIKLTPSPDGAPWRNPTCHRANRPRP